MLIANDRISEAPAQARDQEEGHAGQQQTEAIDVLKEGLVSLVGTTSPTSSPAVATDYGLKKKYQFRKTSHNAIGSKQSSKIDQFEAIAETRGSGFR